MSLTPRIDAAKKEFARKHQLKHAEPETLEAFFTDLVLQDRNLTEFASAQSWKRGTKQFMLGGANDPGIDALLCEIDGQVVLPGQDLAWLDARLGEGDEVQVSFVFVQATGDLLETWERFTSKLARFTNGVFSFFVTDDPENYRSPVREWVALKEAILARLREAEVGGACCCEMYFVWPRRLRRDDPQVERVVRTAEVMISGYADLRELMGPVRLHLMDGENLESMLDERENQPIDLTVSVDRFVRMPCPTTDFETWTGYLTAPELLAAATIGSGRDARIRNAIFARNIRSYLGAGVRTNRAIAETIRSGEHVQFPLRSNGVAIAARRATELPEGRLLLQDVQIVNGSQTTHTLFHERAAPGIANVIVPARLIVSADDDILTESVMGLNRQTPVDEARLVSPRDFVDRLAHLLADPEMPEDDHILLERRDNEFDGRDDVAPERIVALYDLARSFEAAFSARPERVNSLGKKTVLDRIGSGRYFGADHNPEAYRAAATILVRAREGLRASRTRKGWRQYGAKNLLQFAIRLLAVRVSEVPIEGDPASPEAAPAIDALLGVLGDAERCGPLVDVAIKSVQDAASQSKLKLNYTNSSKAVLREKLEKVLAKRAPRGHQDP